MLKVRLLVIGLLRELNDDEYVPIIPTVNDVGSDAGLVERE